MRKNLTGGVFLKKILLISVVLGMVLPLTSFAQEGINIGPVKFQVGLTQFPGKTYWVEEMYQWDTGLGWYKFKVAQKEDSFHVSLLSIRAGTMKPIGPNLSAGLQVGCEVPISSWKKEWENAAGDTSIGEPAEYTQMEWEPIGWLEEPMEEYTQSLKIEEKLLVVPILGKLAYTFPGRGGMKVSTALAFGAYVVNSRITSTMTQTYVEDVPPYETGEEEIWESILSTTACSPGGEFSVQLSLPISPTASIGFNGRLGYIGKTLLFWGQEVTMYAPTDWLPPASPELTTFEQKFEVGGLSYGGGLSLNLSF